MVGEQLHVWGHGDRSIILPLCHRGHLNTPFGFSRVCQNLSLSLMCKETHCNSSVASHSACQRLAEQPKGFSHGFGEWKVATRPCSSCCTSSSRRPGRAPVQSRCSQMPGLLSSSCTFCTLCSAESTGLALAPSLSGECWWDGGQIYLVTIWCLLVQAPLSLFGC